VTGYRTKLSHFMATGLNSVQRIADRGKNEASDVIDVPTQHGQRGQARFTQTVTSTIVSDPLPALMYCTCPSGTWAMRMEGRGSLRFGQ
jgi:hypothetical protein